ncbi:hypothetical protein XENOCAPTIV_027755, partial [Xenoophorus captivus]
DTVSCSRCGVSAAVLRYLWVTPAAHWCHHCLPIAVNYATVTSVYCIEGIGDLPYISMTLSQDLQTRYQVIWTSAFGAAARTFKIRPWQGGLYLPIISYIWRDPTDGFWLPTLHLLDGRVVAIGAHGSPDSPPRVTVVQVRQVSTTTTESSTQTSVTTKSVTCQTIVGDNDEQHQLVSLGELVLQNSPTGDPVREESGPPQLADEWMNEVMLTTPPQPFSPLSPLPPLLSPIRSPIATASQEESVADGSPSPPVLRKELLSSPLWMHPDFIDEFQILNVWSPTPGPPSPHYQDYTEDGVLSFFVYDEDFL